MSQHIPYLRGLAFHIRITPRRGAGVIGTLEDNGDVVFESEFPSYKDAYWALMDMDCQAFVSST